ncbi:hypothetical protein U1Q18_049688 [Sarracenia purpurea var. burkii]
MLRRMQIERGEGKMEHIFTMSSGTKSIYLAMKMQFVKRRDRRISHSYYFFTLGFWVGVGKGCSFGTCEAIMAMAVFVDLEFKERTYECVISCMKLSPKRKLRRMKKKMNVRREKIDRNSFFIANICLGEKPRVEDESGLRRKSEKFINDAALFFCEREY